MDYKIHTHATYATCDAADAFAAAPTYTDHFTADKDAQYEAVGSFFREALNASGGGGDRWAACSKPPLQV